MFHKYQKMQQIMLHVHLDTIVFVILLFFSFFVHLFNNPSFFSLHSQW